MIFILGRIDRIMPGWGGWPHDKKGHYGLMYPVGKKVLDYTIINTSRWISLEALWALMGRTPGILDVLTVGAIVVVIPIQLLDINYPLYWLGTIILTVEYL